MPPKATLVPRSTFASAPTTVRGESCHVSADDACKQFCYPVGTNVVVRSLENPNDVSVFTRHSVPVTCARISPAGHFVASGDRDGNLLIWANNADKLVRLETRPLSAPIRDIAWSEDQQRMVVAGEGKGTMAVAILTDTGNTVGSIVGHEKNIMTCDFKKTRPFRIATGAMDTKLNLYEGPPFKFSKGDSETHKGQVNCVRFSPDGTMIASVASTQNIIALHDGKTGDKLRDISTEHKGTIYSLAWSRDNTMLATAGADKTVRVFQVGDGAVVQSFDMGGSLEFMQVGVFFTSDGLASISLAGDINFLDLATGKPKAIVCGHSKTVKHLSIDPNTARMLSASNDGRMIRWSLDTGLGARLPSVCNLISDVCVNAAGDAAVCGETFVRIAGDESGNVAQLPHPGGAHVGIAFLADGSTAAATSQFITMFDAKNNKVAEEKLKYDADCLAGFGNLIAVGGKDKIVHVYAFADGKLAELLQMKDHTSPVSAVAFSGDGTKIASGDSSRVILLWDAASGAVQRKDLLLHTSRITCLAFSPSGQYLASGSSDTSAVVWNLEGTNQVAAKQAHPGGVTSLCFPSDNTVFSGGVDGNIRQWEVKWE